MATVPYDPNLTVAPSSDPLSVPAARPETFGALTAEARMHAGAALAQAGTSIGSALDAAYKHQKALTDELYANDAMTSAMKDVTQAWSQYNTKEGSGAVAALPGFQKSLDDIYQKHIDAAPNLETKAHLSGALRSLTDSYYKYSQNYADTQFKTWQDKSATEGAQAMGSQAIIAVDNPKQRDMFLAGSDDQIRKLGEQKGLDLPTIDNLVRENRGFNITTMVKSLLANGMSEKAQGVYDTYKDQMSATSRVASEGMLKPIMLQKKAQGGVDDLLNKGIQVPSKEIPLSAIPKGAGGEIATASLGQNPTAIKNAWEAATSDSRMFGLKGYFEKLPKDLQIATARNFEKHPELWNAVPETIAGNKVREPLKTASEELLKSAPKEVASSAAPKEGAPVGSGSTAGLEKSKLPDQYNQSIANHAQNLGANPSDLYAVINYESRFRTNIQGGKGGDYFGLIQFGPKERARYGVHPGMSFDEQMNSVEHFLKDRGFKPGMGLAEMYSIINAGSLDKNGQPRWSASDGNGNIKSHVENIKANFYPGGEAKVDETSTSPWRTGGPQQMGPEGPRPVDLPQPQGASFPAQGSMAGYDPGLPDKGWAMQQILDQTKDEPELRGPMLEYLNKIYQASSDSLLEATRQMELQNKMIQQTSDQNEMKMVQAIDGNDPNFNLLAMEQIPNDQLTREAKERIRSYYKASLSGNEESAVSRKNVADLVTQIYDGKMPTMTPAVKLLGNGKLTQSGFNFVQKQFDDLKTPDGQKLGEFKGRIINAFKAQITGSNSLLGKLDPKGDENLYNFQWFMDKKIQSYREAGKDWTELFDPSNSNYIGKPETIKAFTSSMSEIMKRIVDTNTGLTGEQQAAEDRGETPEGYYGGKSEPAVQSKPTPPFYYGVGETGVGAPWDVITRKPGETVDQWRKRSGR